MKIVAKERKPFVVMLILSSFIFLSSSMGNEPAIVSAVEAQNQTQGIQIDIAPSSDARFFVCGVTPDNGTASLPGLSLAQSSQSVLADRDFNSNILGKAIFDVSSANSSIANVPGPDIVVIEMAYPESMNVSISDPRQQTGMWKIYRPPVSNGAETNDCGYEMNQIMIDLSDFKVPEGSTIPSIRFDNRGVPDTLVGSDIAEIFVSQIGPNGQNVPSNATGTVPFFRQG